MVTGPLAQSGKYPTRPRALTTSRELLEAGVDKQVVVGGLAKTTIILVICGFIFLVTGMAGFRFHRSWALRL